MLKKYLVCTAPSLFHPKTKINRISPEFWNHFLFTSWFSVHKNHVQYYIVLLSRITGTVPCQTSGGGASRWIGGASLLYVLSCTLCHALPSVQFSRLVTCFPFPFMCCPIYIYIQSLCACLCQSFVCCCSSMFQVSSVVSPYDIYLLCLFFLVSSYPC